MATSRILMAMWFVVAVVLSYMGGQRALITHCNTTSFFYYQGRTYECLPYNKIIWDSKVHPEPANAPH